jgi:hypothetical protein
LEEATKVAYEEAGDGWLSKRDDGVNDVNEQPSVVLEERVKLEATEVAYRDVEERQWCE